MRFRRPRLHDYHLYVVILWGVSFEYGVTPRVTSGVPQISLRAPQSAAAARRRRSLGRQDQDSSQSRPSAEKNIFSFCGHFCRHFSGGFLEAFFARTKKKRVRFWQKKFQDFFKFFEDRGRYKVLAIFGHFLVRQGFSKLLKIDDRLK